MQMGQTFANRRLLAQQDGRCDLLIDQNLRGSQYFVLLAFRKHDALGRLLGFVDHDAHHALHLAQAAFQLFTIFEKIHRLLRYARIHGRLGHSSRLPQQHARIERFGDDVLRTEFETFHAVSAADGIRDLLTRELGQGVSSGQLHRVVDGGGSYVQRASKNEGKAQYVVHLVRIIGPSGGDNGIRPGFDGYVVGNFGIRICEREHDGVVGHGNQHLGRNAIRY